MILSDIAEIFDCPHSTAPDEGEGYPLIRTPNVGKGRLLLDGVHRVCRETYLVRTKRAIPRENDIIFAREAPAGNAAVIVKGQNVCLGQRTVLIRPNNRIVNSHYLVYYLLLPKQQIKLIGYAHGSTVGHVNIPDLAKLPVDLPDYETQNRIANIIERYDNLIEVNNKRIKVLEQMAENLYKEWFVRFRFPGYENAEFENGIPKGWETTRLGEIMSFTRGVGYSSEDIVDGETALLSMNNIRPYGGYISDNSRVYSGKYKKDQLIEENDLIMSITDMTQDRRIIGYTGIANYSEMPRVICTHLMKITSNEYDNFFLYSFFTYSGLSRYISEYATGANVLGLTADILKRIKCNIPDVRMAKRFSEKVKPLFYHIHLLEKSNSILIKQRDLLLPRLMSGRLEV